MQTFVNSESLKLRSPDWTSVVSNFLFFFKPGPMLPATQIPIQRVTEILSSVVKRQKREANHSPRVSVKLKNEWNLPLYPSYVQGVHRDN